MQHQDHDNWVVQNDPYICFRNTTLITINIKMIIIMKSTHGLFAISKKSDFLVQTFLSVCLSDVSIPFEIRGRTMASAIISQQSTGFAPPCTYKAHPSLHHGDEDGQQQRQQQQQQPQASPRPALTKLPSPPFEGGGEMMMMTVTKETEKIISISIKVDNCCHSIAVELNLLKSQLFSNQDPFLFRGCSLTRIPAQHHQDFN